MNSEPVNEFASTRRRVLKRNKKGLDSRTTVRLHTEACIETPMCTKMEQPLIVRLHTEACIETFRFVHILFLILCSPPHGGVY